jgi:putative ABC transport system substrate-binding protein
VGIEFRWASGQYDRLPEMVADLVRRQASVIAANTPSSLVAKAATSTIPIVFTTGTDPVQFGLVASLNRPGGNVTGVTQLTEDVAPKRVELAHELIPTATVIGFLVNPRNPNVGHLTRVSQAAAAKLGLQLDVVHASSEAELDDAFTAVLQKRSGALVISANSLNELIIKLAARYTLPVVYHERESVTGGGLISYSGSITDSYHLAGVYVGRILKGDKPADLPVQQVTKVDLVINLKTAKALGLTVPMSLLGRAEEVIE